MCKLFIATGKLTRKQTEAALFKANEFFRKSENDGFGFIAANGLHVARGRYFEPDSFAGYQASLPAWLSGPHVEENPLPANPDVLLIHGRTSTNTKALVNVHPFYHKSHYLAHNGIVFWTGEKDAEPKPACDSEQLLHWLVESGYDWNSAKEFWAGWGAVADYDVKAGVLTIAKYGASLFIARRANGRGWVFATDKGHLLGVCKAAGITLDTPPMTFPAYVVKLRAGRFISDHKFDGFGTRMWTTGDDLARGIKSTKAIGAPGDGKRHIVIENKSAKHIKWISKQESKELFPDYEPEAK